MSLQIHRKNRPRIMAVALSKASVSSVGPALGPMCFCQRIPLNLFCFKSIGLANLGRLFFAPLNAGFLAAHLSRMASLLRRFAA